MVNTEKTTSIVVSDEAHLQTDAEAIEALLVGFGEGNLTKVRDALNLLGKASEQALHVRVNELTQEFHTRLSGFKNSLSADQITMTTTNIPDAARKLEFVLNATNEATHKLFGMIERLETLLNSLDNSFKDLAVDLESGNTAARAKRVKEYSEFKKQWLIDARGILCEMVIGQEHQDLCGQALSKVLKLVKELETNLTVLIKQFGLEASASSVPHPDDTKVGQEDADDLLKQLGF